MKTVKTINYSARIGEGRMGPEQLGRTAMPFVRITTRPALPADARVQLAKGTTRLMADVLGKRADLTSVLVEEGGGTWTVGGIEPPRAAHLDALVTAGTNTEAEKATFLAQAMALLTEAAGALPEATYVVVREVPATDWGYDGLSQAFRKSIAKGA
jgi:4-oxalocrotonate tautomerase